MVIKSLLYNVLTLCILDELIFPTNFDNKGLFVAGDEGVWLVLLYMAACLLNFVDIYVHAFCVHYIHNIYIYIYIYIYIGCLLKCS